MVRMEERTKKNFASVLVLNNSDHKYSNKNYNNGVGNKSANNSTNNNNNNYNIKMATENVLR